MRRTSNHFSFFLSIRFSEERYMYRRCYFMMAQELLMFFRIACKRIQLFPKEYKIPYYFYLILDWIDELSSTLRVQLVENKEIIVQIYNPKITWTHFLISKYFYSETFFFWHQYHTKIATIGLPLVTIILLGWLRRCVLWKRVYSIWYLIKQLLFNFKFTTFLLIQVSAMSWFLH